MKHRVGKQATSAFRASSVYLFSDLDAQGHADELWQAIAELSPAPTALLLYAKTGGGGAGGGHPLCPQS